MAIENIDVGAFGEKADSRRINWDQFWQDVGKLTTRGQAVRIPEGGSHTAKCAISMVSRALARPISYRTVNGVPYVVHL